MRAYALTAAVALLLVNLVSAQSKPAATPAPSGPFASGRDLTCSFPLYVAPTHWAEGAPSVVSNTEEFAFQITSIDPKKRTARIVSGTASDLASIILTQIGLHVIEQTDLGNLNVTTVFAAGGHNGTFLAVHSRHIGDLSAPPTVSQHYGSCQYTQATQ